MSSFFTITEQLQVKLRRLQVNMTGQAFDRFLVISSLVLFVVFCLLKIHGFSIGSWHYVLGQDTPVGKVLFGEPRGIRSDDWLTALPIIFGQINHVPQFPIHNVNMFGGQNLLGLYVPINHAVTLFRPTLWGYFLSPDFGMAWQWWGRFFGLAAAVYILQVRTIGILRMIAFPLTVLFLYSPFIQFWSMNCAEIFMFAMFSVIFFKQLIQATNARVGISCGLLCGYSGAAMVFTLYPPYQIVVGWFCLLTMVILFAHYGSLKSSRFVALGAFAGILVVIFSIADWYFDSQELIANMTSTAYPGHRFFNGGDMSMSRLFVSTFFINRQVSNWTAFGNICESASFVLLFPLGIVSYYLFSSGFRDRAQALLFYGGMAFLGFVITFLVFGLPNVYVKYTLFSQVLTQRALSGVGLASTVVTGLGIHAATTHPSTFLTKYVKRSWVVPMIAGLAIAAAMYFLGQSYRHELGVKVSYINKIAIFYGVAAFVLFRGFPQILFVISLLGVWSTGFFNPIVVGGYDDLRHSRLAEFILEVHKQHPRSAWIGVGSTEIGNFVRMLGIQTYSGLQFEPKNSLWSQLDESLDSKNTYNRFAHVTVRLKSQGDSRPSFELTQMDSFTAWIDTQSPFFARNQIDFILSAGPSDTQMSSLSKSDFEFKDSVGNWTLLQRKNSY